MQDNAVSPAVQEEIQATIDQVRQQIANQPQINVEELLAGIRAQMPANSNENESFSDLLNALDESLVNLNRVSSSGSTDVSQEWNDVLNAFAAMQAGGSASLQQEREKVMNQNTVLLGHPKVPIALYKRDLMTLPFMAFDVFLAYKVLKTYKNNCVEHIYKILTKDPDYFIALFTELKDAEQKINERNVSRTERAQLVGRIKEINTMIAETFSYVGSNAFKTDMVMPLIMALVGHKASSYARKKIMKVNSFMPEAFNAYTRNSNGEYERFVLDPMYYSIDQDHRLGHVADRLSVSNSNQQTIGTIGTILLKLFFFDKAPMSVTRVLNIPITNPNIDLIQDYMPDVKNMESPTLNKMLYKLIGLPDWFYTVSHSPVTKALIEAATIWQILLLIDHLYIGSLIKAATQENRSELIALLNNYKNIKKKKQAESELKKFITSHMAMPSWRTASNELFTFIFQGRGKVNRKILAWTFASCTSYLLWKNRTLIKAGYSAAKDGLIPPDISIIIGVYALYAAIPFAFSVTTVCKDLWGLSKKVFSFFKKKKNNKKKNIKPVLIGGK